MNHSPITSVHFTKNSSDFIVNEIPLYDFSGEGEHAVLHVRKRDLTTWQMLKAFSEASGAKVRDFGYAGLKDKDGMTTQYISIHKSYLPKLENFNHDKIKILSTTFHNNKIKIGHLLGNRFFIRLKKVLPVDALKLEQALKTIQKEGFPNYFGYQRFGVNRQNYAQGLEILEGKRREKNRKIRDFLISAFQSYLFNEWLSYRIEISKIVQDFSPKEISKSLGFDLNTSKDLKAQKPFLKLFEGDICHHFPHGKAFICQDPKSESLRFSAQEITLAGWLAGNKGLRAEKIAGQIESKYYQQALSFLDKMRGTHRFAWSFAKDVEYNYRKEEAWFEMHFTLQKGSYATVVLEEILKREL
jgi:tRNA pseudouridine13 synthase